MKLSDILGKTFDCECGRRHTVSTEHLFYGPDAMARLPETALRYVSRPDYLILADRRTYPIAGYGAEKALKDHGASVRHFIVSDPGGKSPVTDDETRESLLRDAPHAGAYIAVGSGVISDLTKWIACDRGKPFLTVATAASMNGYASANVAASMKGLKVLFHSNASKSVFALPETIEQAPFELTAAGLGDMLAKSVSSADWKLNQFLFDEYCCPFAIDLVKGLETFSMDHPERILNRQPEAIRSLFEALFYSGLSMTIAGTSAPASGGEHLISHSIDMICHLEGKRHDVHGRQVGVGTILSAALYEELLSIETPRFRTMPPDVDGPFWGLLTDVVRNEYGKKVPKFESAVKGLSSPKNWDNLRAILKETVLPPRKIKDCLKKAGAAHRIGDIRIDGAGMEMKKFQEIWVHAHQMRERFTILDLAALLGIMPVGAERLISEWVLE